MEKVQISCVSLISSHSMFPLVLAANCWDEKLIKFSSQSQWKMGNFAFKWKYKNEPYKQDSPRDKGNTLPPWTWLIKILCLFILFIGHDRMFPCPYITLYHVSLRDIGYREEMRLVLYGGQQGHLKYDYVTWQSGVYHWQWSMWREGCDCQGNAFSLLRLSQMLAMR